MLKQNDKIFALLCKTCLRAEVVSRVAICSTFEQKAAPSLVAGCVTVYGCK